MEIRKRIRSSIVPGRRMITHVAACYEAGMMENMSYLAEKTIANDSSLDETQDLEEREWKRQGLSDIEIFKRLENRKLKRLQNAEDRLKKEKYGAKNFDELLERPEYSECESEFEKNDENVQKKFVFAIPSLPKHLSEKSMMGSPAVGARGSGKAGLSCSTPKSGHNVSMGSLRGLDISHVVSIDRLDENKVTVHNKNVLIPIVENDDSTCQKTYTIQKDQNSGLQGTFIVARDEEADNQRNNDARKDTEESSLQKTFTVAEDKNDDKRNSSLQDTFVVAEDKNDDKRNSSLQETFTVAENKNGDKRNSSLQETFTVAEDKNDDKRNSSLEETYTVISGWNDTLMGLLPKPHGKESSQKTKNDSESVQILDDTKITEIVTNDTIIKSPDNARIVLNTIEGGKEKRKSKKVDLQERERRYANITMSLSNMSNITVGDMPSPGSYRFKQLPKKSKPTIKTPPKTKMMNRLSTESDKEKTIEMLSIAEEASMEADSNGPSFVDPLSVNGSCVSPVPELDEFMDVSSAVTPKSSRRICNTPIREKSMEMARARSLAATPTIKNVESNNTLSATTPKHHYQKPTISSLVKSKITIDSNDLLEASRRDRRHTPGRTANRTPDRHRTQTVENATESPIDEQEEEEAALKDETLNKRNDEKMNEMNDESISNAAATSNRSLNNIEFELDAMTVSDQQYSDDFDYDKPQSFSDDRGIDEDTESEESVTRLRPRQKSTRRRVELLSNSMASTPGIDRRSTRRQGTSNETVAEDTWYHGVDYEVPQMNNKNRKNKITVGLQLKKREIIKPEPTYDNVRRSDRTRVKPVRSWLGERAVYENSPRGGKRLTGVTEVTINDKRLCKYRTADPKLATEREQKERAMKKANAARRRRELALDHKRGRRLNDSQDDIHTDDEMD